MRGPPGIVGVLGHEAELRGITVLSMWVGVPHYVAHPPNPRATLALLGQIERLVGAPIDLGNLQDEADAWTRGADELAEDDEEIGEHVRQLGVAHGRGEPCRKPLAKRLPQSSSSSCAGATAASASSNAFARSTRRPDHVAATTPVTSSTTMAAANTMRYTTNGMNERVVIIRRNHTITR